MPGEAGEKLECAWCGGVFIRPSDRGSVPRYCSGNHRNQEYAWRDLGRLLAPHVREGHLTAARVAIWTRVRFGRDVPQFRLDREKRET